MDTNVFEYLDQDMNAILWRLRQTIDHYAEWPRDRIFEEIKKDLAALKIHFDKEVLLERNATQLNDGQAVIDEAHALRKAISTEIDDLVMIHVDEPGFEQGLESINDKLAQYEEFCKDRFFPTMKKRLTEDELNYVQSRLNLMLLS